MKRDEIPEYEGMGLVVILAGAIIFACFVGIVCLLAR
jgi:hypothetical protein